MKDFPWWMGLAPLLGFLLDALLGGSRVDAGLEDRVRLVGTRMRRVMQASFRGERAGYAHMIWMGSWGAVAGWAIPVLGYVVFQEYGLFLVRALVFFLMFSARRLTMEGIQSLAWIATGEADKARALMSRFARLPADHDARAWFGALTTGLCAGTLGATLLPFFWGTLGGTTLAGAALAAHLGAASRPEVVPEEDAAFWRAVARVDHWITAPAVWLGGLTPMVLGAVGGSVDRGLRGWMSPAAVPEERMAAVAVHGFGLPTRPDGTVEAEPGAVQQVVQVLFLAGFLTAAVCSAVGAFLHWLI